MHVMSARASYERIFVAAFVGAIGSLLTQTVVERYIPALSPRMVGAVVFTSLLLYGGVRPRPSVLWVALALLWAVGVAYLFERFM
jgi:hypothetical protein